MPNPLVSFEAPAPCCGEVCWWTATSHSTTPHCPRCTPDLPASTTGKTSAPGTRLGDAA